MQSGVDKVKSEYVLLSRFAQMALIFCYMCPQIYLQYAFRDMMLIFEDAPDCMDRDVFKWFYIEELIFMSQIIGGSLFVFIAHTCKMKGLWNKCQVIFEIREDKDRVGD